MVAVRNESQVILIFYDNDVQMRLSSSHTQQMMEDSSPNNAASTLLWSLDLAFTQYSFSSPITLDSLINVALRLSISQWARNEFRFFEE